MKLLQFFVCLLPLICFNACKPQDQVKVLRLAHGLDTNHPVHKAMEYMGEELEKNSNGRLTVTIYPSGQLGSERECLELLQIGSVDISKVSAAVLENFVPVFSVLSIPYLFESREHAYQVYDSETGTDLLAEGLPFRLKGLGFYDAGSRSFYTKERAIQSPADLEGLKIRVQKSKMAVRMVELLGGAPTPISWGELYTALQQGVVDGAENNLPSFYTSRHYEVCKFYSLDEHTAVPDVLMMSANSWNRLTPQEQAWLTDAVNSSVVYQRALWQEAEKEALKAIEEAGVSVYRPDKAAFSAATEEIMRSFKNDTTVSHYIHKIKQLR